MICPECGTRLSDNKQKCHFCGHKFYVITTLNELINKKYKIITALGVFGALTLFSISLQVPILIFGCLAIFLILSYELFNPNIPEREVGYKKSLFSTLELFLFFFYIALLFGM